MSKHSYSGPVAPLQWIVLEPITDPIELAAIDEQRRRNRELRAGGEWIHEETTRTPENGTSGSDLVALFDEFTVALSANQLLTLGKILIDRLPPAEARQLEQRLRDKLAASTEHPGT
jgi:hypothetical protein